jgi:large subunit ribosomal protein L29
MNKTRLSAKDLANQSDEKLRDQLFLFKKELFNLRFQQTLGELKNSSKFSEVKKNIARVKTEFARRMKLGE